MDITTLAMAKAYTDSKQLASEELAPKVEWDGNTEGKAEYYGYGEWALYRISDTPMDLNELTKIVVSSQSGINEVFWELRNSDYGQIANYADPEWGATFVAAYVYSVTEEFTYSSWGQVVIVPVGLYVYGGSDEWVSLLQFGEDVINTIDPKYLPDSVALEHQERLIRRITVNTGDVMSCVIDKDEQGNAFALDKVFLMVDCPIATTAASGEVVVCDADNSRVFGYSSSVANATKRYVHKAWFERCGYGYAVNIANTGNPMYNLSDDSSQSKERIAKLSLTTTAALPIGTVIEVWGK